MNFNLTDEQTLLMQTVRQFAEEVVAPGAIERDDCPITVIARPRQRPWQSRMGDKHTRSPRGVYAERSESACDDSLFLVIAKESRRFGRDDCGNLVSK